MLYTFIIVRSSIGTSAIKLESIPPKAFLIDIFIAASTSLVLSRAAELAAFTTVVIVPAVAKLVPPNELTASLCAFRTSCVALVVEKKRFNKHI